MGSIGAMGVIGFIGSTDGPHSITADGGSDRSVYPTVKAVCSFWANSLGDRLAWACYNDRGEGGAMSDELCTLAQAISAYCNARNEAQRRVMERLIDDLERMIREGRSFGDPPFSVGLG